VTAPVNCEQVREIAAELALGTAPGDLREGAVRHLERCSSCRGDVEALADTADALLHVLPPVDPPAGFESRVLARIAADVDTYRVRPSRRRGWAVGLAAAAALVLATGAGAPGHAALSHAPAPTSQTAALVALERAPNPGARVGAAYLAGRLLVVSVDNIGYDGPCTVRVNLTDGSVAVFPGPTLRNGSGSAGITLPAPSHSVRTVTILDRRGYAMGAASFGQP
jgi:hypothetical protein